MRTKTLLILALACLVIGLVLSSASTKIEAANSNACYLSGPNPDCPNPDCPDPDCPNPDCPHNGPRYRGGK